MQAALLSTEREAEGERTTDQEWLADRPANTAKHHGRQRQAWLFFRWADEAADNGEKRADLQAFLRTCLVNQWHTSLTTQLLGRSLNQAGHATPPVCSILLTGRSFRHLGIEPPLDAVFAGGMAENRAQLGDVAPGELGAASDPWIGFGYERDFDVALTVADDTQTAVDELVRTVSNAAASHGLRCELVERGFAWRPDGPKTALREPFGFRDDVSNVLFLDEDVSAYENRLPRPAASEVGTWKQVFHLPAGDDQPRPATAEGGSFVVLRKLEQHVQRFNALGRQTEALTGRQRSGAPLVVPGRGGENDFNYATDMAAPPRCPFHAHVRKANPRGSSVDPEDPNHAMGLAEERATLFPRRGMVYAPDHGLPNGPYDPEKMPQAGVGLLFVGYMGQIDSQFIRMQTSWLNNPLFPTTADRPGRDLIVGAASDFVTPRGGVYLYAPPMGWLRQTANA